MQTTMKTIDSKINQIPDWLMGVLFGGLIYSLLSLLFFILSFVDLDLGILSWLKFGFRSAGFILGSLMHIPPIIAGSIPCLFIGGLFGAVKSRNGRIILLLFLTVLILLPIAFVIYVMMSALWVSAHW